MKTWIAFGIVCVVVIATVLVCLLVLIPPQYTLAGTQTGEYEKISKQEYTFSGEELKTLRKEYGVTQSDVDSGKKKDKFDEGNINPFTPKKEVTIYNEPTLENDNKLNSGTLTPDDK